MTTAWDILVAGSTAPLGSNAWEHLQNQASAPVVAPTGYRVVMAGVPEGTAMGEVLAVADIATLSDNVMISTVEVKYGF